MIEEKITEYMQAHKIMTIATYSEGQPLAHTVQFVSEGLKLYFFTKAQQRKVKNIKENPEVGFTIDHQYDNWGEIQGVQGQGKAKTIEEQEEYNRVFELFVGKFPHMANLPTAFKEHHLIIAVVPEYIRFLDNKVSFGHFDAWEAE